MADTPSGHGLTIWWRREPAPDAVWASFKKLQLWRRTFLNYAPPMAKAAVFAGVPGGKACPEKEKPLRGGPQGL
jgi:hypothetical protein